MQATLGKFGFKRQVTTPSGRTYDLFIPDTVEKDNSNRKAGKSSSCPVYCKKIPGYTHYFKHPGTELLDEKTENNKENSSKCNSNLVRNLTQSNGNTNSRSMDSVMSINAPRPRESTKRKNTGGSAIRKSYTLDFKIKTLKLLDEVENQKDIKHKTDYVAKKKGVHKSLVVKWKSNKAELLKQLSDNAHNRSTSTTPSIRLRRKINSGKRSRHAWFPFAENNVMIDYKRKRSLGERITKLWLKTKMRVAIRGICGDAAANKFKTSQNWVR